MSDKRQHDAVVQMGDRQIEKITVLQKQSKAAEAALQVEQVKVGAYVEAILDETLTDEEIESMEVNTESGEIRLWFKPADEPAEEDVE